MIFVGNLTIKLRYKQLIIEGKLEESDVNIKYNVTIVTLRMKEENYQNTE